MVIRLVDTVPLAKHAIGLDSKKPYKRHGKLFYRPYRNYYFASANYREPWEVLVNFGYAERGKELNLGGRVYFLTRKGLDWLGEQLNIHIYDEED